MSIVKMRKMSLVAHNSERNKLLRIFIKNGCMEFVRSKKAEENDLQEYSDRIARIESKQYKIAFALSFLKDTVKTINLSQDSKKDKLNFDLKKENRLVSYEEYMEAAKDEMELLAKISDMEKINARLTDIKSESARINSFVEQIRIYKDIAIPFGIIKDTQKTFSLLGTIPTDKKEELISKLPQAAEIETATSDKVTAVLLIAHNEYKEEITSLLSSCEFVRASFEFTCSAAEQIERLEQKLRELEKEREVSICQVKNYLQYGSVLKVTYDYYGLEIEKVRAQAGCMRTQKAIVMEGWVPVDKEKKIVAEIEKNCSRAEVEFRDPLPEEVPPTLTRNNKVVSAFDGITDMFGAPNYLERDPKIFVAFYYFLIFGFMLGDAGYGLIMAIACFLFTAIKKPVKNSGQMILMFGFCGLSTVLWGALFGGWFGMTPAFMDKVHLFWFKPLEQPLIMFALALGVGLLQIGNGFALHGVATIKQGGVKNILLGVLKDFGWVVMIIGLFLFSPSLLAFLGIIQGELSPAVKLCVQAGMYVALIGAAMMLLSGLVGKKNPVKAVGGVLSNAYGAINVVSDLLSYSRLFGLGLTSGVIGYVVNMLAYDVIVVMFCGGQWFGWLIAVPVLVIGHVFNLAINLLGAYVHDSRLQYIEFFGRFYEGSGHAYKPIGSGVKYTYIDN